jgi:hypothetical protein
MKKIKFEDLTQEQKDNLLKTLVIAATRTTDTLELLERYAHYGGQAFDSMINVELEELESINETQTVIRFRKKV